MSEWTTVRCSAETAAAIRAAAKRAGLSGAALLARDYMGVASPAVSLTGPAPAADAVFVEAAPIPEIRQERIEVARAALAAPRVVAQPQWTAPAEPEETVSTCCGRKGCVAGELSDYHSRGCAWHTRNGGDF